MSAKDQAFRERLLATFRVEAEEHLAAMANGLLELETKTHGPEQRRAIVEAVFRAAHSLKGAARAVGLSDVESTCMSLESALSQLRRGDSPPSHDCLDGLHRGVAAVSNLLGSGGQTVLPRNLPSEDEEGRKPAEANEPAAAGPVQSGKAIAETVRIGTEKLDEIFLQVEELGHAKLTAAGQVLDLQRTTRLIGQWRKKSGEAFPAVRRIERALNKTGNGHGSAGSRSDLDHILEYFEWEDDFAKSLETLMAGHARAADHNARFLASRADALREDAKRLLMLPFSTILQLVPNMVRDLSRARGKETDFIIEGEETEVDKRILEEMKDPLIHLLRNSVDHGIESPETRKAKNKPARGRIFLRITQKNSNVELRLSDDGAGIDRAKVVAAAVKAGIASTEEAAKMHEDEVFALIFRSGISTSPIVTDLSGLGLGLAIVREKVEKLGGSVNVVSSPDQGTTFQIVLPVTLATFRGLLVRAAERVFVFPTAAVERAVRVSPLDIRTAENRETIEFAGRPLSMVRIEDLLGLDPPQPMGDKAKLPVLILRSGQTQIGCAVQEVLGEQEVLVKGISKPFSQMQYLAGATVLASGQVAPILNVNELIQAAAKGRSTRSPADAADGEADEEKAILVADDSITARSLLKNILESAGYQVKTAVDGVDALSTLKSGDFALVISDVEMPGLNGFELTERIRADKRLAELPLILVTSLDSREDKQRGVDAGADAYIVKSSFDQSNLLEVVRRLI